MNATITTFLQPIILSLVTPNFVLVKFNALSAMAL
jgi:hypothetical protein